MSKVVLLNPPGKKTYFRDYYCTKISKANYYYHPIDFVFLSGIIAQTHELSIIDAIAENLSVKDTLIRINTVSPQYIISLVSEASFKEDTCFINEIKKNIDTKIVCCGDIMRENSMSVLEKHLNIDAILLDFSTNDILSFIDNANGQIIDNILYRYLDKIIVGEEKHHTGIFDIPRPKHKFFNKKHYIFPFAKHRYFSSILTDFGCAFNCDYCPIASLKFKYRSVSSVIDEMQEIKNMGIKELYIRDQTFGVNINRTMQLLDEMINNNFSFSWTCLSRVDVLSFDILKKMKKAGCHTIMLGVESANNEILKKFNKEIDHSVILSKLELIRSFKIDVGGFFMIGFPFETEDSINNTIKFALSLPLQYASFNLVTPRSGTVFRKKAITDNLINDSIVYSESSYFATKWNNPEISSDRIKALKKKAVIKFYMRPKLIINKIISLKSLDEFLILIRVGLSLLKKNLKNN